MNRSLSAKRCMIFFLSRKRGGTRQEYRPHLKIRTGLSFLSEKILTITCMRPRISHGTL
jgi:hypothetical protein